MTAAAAAASKSIVAGSARTGSMPWNTLTITASECPTEQKQETQRPRSKPHVGREPRQHHRAPAQHDHGRDEQAQSHRMHNERYREQMLVNDARKRKQQHEAETNEHERQPAASDLRWEVACSQQIACETRLPATKAATARTG